jgi:hypothetical protein
MTPVDRAADERLPDASAAPIGGDGDETDGAALPGLVHVDGYVPRRRATLVRNEHRLRPTVAAAADPGLVEVVAPPPRKPRIRIEARVAVAHTRHRPQSLDVALVVLAHSRMPGRGRAVELDANVDQTKAGPLRGQTLSHVAGVHQQVQALDSVGTGPVIRLGGRPAGPADADSPELRVPVEQLSRAQRASVSSTIAYGGRSMMRRCMRARYSPMTPSVTSCTPAKIEMIEARNGKPGTAPPTSQRTTA